MKGKPSPDQEQTITVGATQLEGTTSNATGVTAPVTETRTVDIPDSDLPEWAPRRGEYAQRDVPIQVRRNKAPGSEVENRTAVIINTAQEDRHGTIIDPRGADLAEYQRNPVVLINHWHDLLAATSSVSKSDQQLVATLNDEDWDHEDPEVERWFRKLKRGMLRAASVGARVRDYVWEMIDPAGDASDWENLRMRITDWELVEWSFVTVGSNPGALVTQRMLRDEGMRLYSFQRRSPDVMPEKATSGEQEPAEQPAPESQPASDLSADGQEKERTAPLVRAATPAEYAALAAQLVPVVREQVLRSIGKR